MGKTKPYIVNSKTVAFFIDKKGGVKKEQVIKDLMEFVNLDKESAETSIRRALKLNKIIEKNGKLYLNFPTRTKAGQRPAFSLLNRFYKTMG